MVRSLLLAISLFLGLAPCPQTQEKPPTINAQRQKFAGIWAVDPKKNKRSTSKLVKIESLEITYDEPVLKMVRTITIKHETRSASVVLYTDGRGEVNQPFPFNPTFEEHSKTAWDGAKFTRTYAIKYFENSVRMGDLITIETYSVSADGNSLSIESASRVEDPDQHPGKRFIDGEGTLTLLFDRKLPTAPTH